MGSYIKVRLKVQRLNSISHQDFEVIGEKIRSKFPNFPGLQQDPHLVVFVLVSMSLPWSDQALSGLIYLIAIRLGLIRSYQNVG